MTAAAGRKQVPTNLRIIKGQGTNSRGEDLDSGGRVIPPPVGFARLSPDKPEDMSEDASWLWDLIVDQLERVELLKPLDAASLEAACETYARWKEAVRFRLERGLLAKNSQGLVTAPWIGIEERASKEFRSWCAEYGLTPAAEGKLNASPAETEDNVNPFD